ncbi:hypothetical protein [Idiomarina seosinensis]|uniref:DUF4386 domain-containing protein n=1 Tax=Idiomarina seosinensis TaxID=281739 RepID=A0A432Z748_9GAMM|nr:hypothetical protein [Idiomarina seosinensis]RUO73721.1 hypothetical protein CWI81_11910 [Idiomarina seosinensis]
MIAMHTTLSGRLPPVAGMFGLLGIAVTVGALASIYMADWFIHPMQWLSDFLRNVELTANSLMHLAGLSNDLQPSYYSFAKKSNVGVFAGGLYIATEVLYLVAVVVLATKTATASSSQTVRQSAPKKTVTLYLLLNLAYTIAFFYWIMFDLQFARNYQDALLGPLRTQVSSLSGAFIGSWSWKLILFIPFQLLLMVAVWRGSPWFKKAFASYLLIDVVYYSVLTVLTSGSHSGLFVSTIGLLLFTPYLVKAPSR